MAGTSPDRSKRYESSTGSTSGSEAPIPDTPAPGGKGSLPGQSSGSTEPPPDPRVSMSRGPAPKVDQATAVFSRRALLEAAEAEGLKPAEAEGAERAKAEGAKAEEARAEEAGTAGSEDVEPGTVGSKADGPETGRGDAADGEGSDAGRSDDAGSDDGDGADEAAEGSDGDTEAQPDSEAAEDEDEPSRDDDEAEDEPSDAAGDEAADADAESEAGAEADKGPGTEDENAPGSASADELPDDEPEAADGDEPEAADGEDAPQGSPADDDESRTGGAGGADGKSEGDGGAEADRPVDQPTAIFRAPRPPAVDQPTTMLKLGGGAAKPADVDEGDEDAKSDDADVVPPVERTSKFVALKPLDEPAAPKPPQGAADAAALSPAEATRAIPQVGPERTTQQPLPPRPPLDLLAELTNTPPPRQTPVRTVIRRVKIWTPLAILLAIVFAVVQAVRPLPTPTLALTADESYAFEGEKASLPWPDEGQGWMDVNGIGTVDSFGEQKPAAIGSVAKAMTAYVILKEHPMKVGAKGATIPVDEKAEIEGGYDEPGKGESTLNTVKEGDKLTQYDAIAAIMIPSANNIARLLARWDSNGSEEEFVKKMNAAAKDLGMTNTTYTDPSGLKETTVSTAEDQVKLGNALVKMKALTDITRLPEWIDPSGLKHRNYNTLVPYDNAIGIKTGSTTAAGGNLLFAATKEVGGETVIVVGAILGQHTSPIIDTVNAVSKTAMVAAQDALTSSTILKKGDVVGYVDDGLGGQTPVVVTQDVSAVGWAGKTVKLELDPSESIPNEAKTGTEVGSLTVGDGSGDGVQVPVALQKDLTEPGFGTRLTRVS
ncbi:D-alanyl-D-alanine carboxypeptidase [Streptomyces sp. DSM 40750]|uniref:D-alanyl-D-alanine carboxypeptidase n=1 Tax=Streptomyces sp. DSM 40750 TaxID=2801030 RepID=UPI00214C07A8|nr:D-alanyl-D-alanine carboxypeptidase [Streptomyces sp. DSM 40750]UUU22891.1 D-alanyl-D-alanine carboxypeptidase [Streptomyces sp. DSM 40750]